MKFYEFHDIQQGHIDWFRLRMGKVTASELGNLLTPDFAVRKGETPRTYLFEKLAEDWRGQPLIQTGSWATEQGQLREEEAVPWLALETGWKIRNGGFCVSDDGHMGCSPDGLCDDFGIEVKCPEPTAHVRYLMDGILPKAYICQVYGSMYVTGFKRWFFLSYQRGFPPLLLEIQRDEKIMQSIGEAAARFKKDFDHAKARLRWIDAGGFNQDVQADKKARSPEHYEAPVAGRHPLIR